jgi:hypothetical protein
MSEHNDALLQRVRDLNEAAAADKELRLSQRNAELRQRVLDLPALAAAARTTTEAVVAPDVPAPEYHGAAEIIGVVQYPVPDPYRQ